MSRHALVTGVSSGIGAAIADELLTQGWQVTGFSRTPVEKDHPAFTSVSVDLFDAGQLKRALAGLAKVDALVHAAGMMLAAPLGELEEEQGRGCGICTCRWRKSWPTPCCRRWATAIVFCCSAAARHAARRIAASMSAPRRRW